MEATSRLFGLDRLLGYTSPQAEEEKFEQHFYKLKVKLLLENVAKEDVNGTLLLTQSSLMFDPSRDDVVASRDGVEKYGMMCDFTGMSSIFCLQVAASDNRNPHDNFLCVGLVDPMKKTYSTESSNDTATSADDNSTSPDDNSTASSLHKNLFFKLESSNDASDLLSFLTESQEDDHFFAIEQNPDFSKEGINFDRISSTPDQINTYWQVKRKRTEDDAVVTSPDAVTSSHMERSATSSQIAAMTSSTTTMERSMTFSNDVTSSFVEEACSFDYDAIQLEGESKIFPLCPQNTLNSLGKELPARLGGYPWQLAYSTCCHGMSLQQLYRNMKLVNPLQTEVATLLVVQDVRGNVFGSFCSCQPRVSETFYGNGENFLFQLTGETPRFHKWTGENRFFMKGNKDSLSFGSSGGKVGLWVGERLFRGMSQSCKTFDNPPLSYNRDFSIQTVEVWCLTS